MRKSVLLASLVAAVALAACGKKEESAPAVVTPSPAPSTSATTPPAPSPGASTSLDAANAATEAAKKKEEAPKQ
jgi:hypothetical protein